MLPEIDHIVVVMMENHSYDNVLGMLGRGPGEKARGDGFTLGADGRPTAANPDGHGNLIHAFPMPNPCQEKGKPWQTWDATHQSYDGGRMDGFVESPSGPVAMGYYTGALLPFTYSLASTFPIADRYFSSVMAQTYPNRLFLMGGTSLGQVSDASLAVRPPAGTVFDMLDAHGISWRNYHSSLPSSWIYADYITDSSFNANVVGIDRFFEDASTGSLPSFAIVDPDFEKSSEEDPQDVQYGDQFLGQVVNAIMQSPAWPKVLLVWTYDEHGGYYDHVPPPPAVPPDSVPPKLPPNDPYPGGFDRYGIRVPAGVVSPFAKRDYVSHVVYDHTSILRLVETKWNLPSLTARDANAANLLDMVDLHRRPAFLEPPELASPANPAALSGCLLTGPGTIPPPGYVSPGTPPPAGRSGGSPSP